MLYNSGVRKAHLSLLLLAGSWLALAYQAAPGVHPVTGRKIAGVMGMNGADWLVRPEREVEEQPEKALDALNLKPGNVVADIGAGVGYMSLRMAKRVGATGKVYANDLQPQMLDLLRQNAAKAGLTNIVTVLGDVADPKLPANTMDLVLLVDVYHEFSQPQVMLRKIRETLKPDGRLVLLEYRAEDPNVPIIAEHKMTVAQVRTELEAEGFVLQPVIETLPRQHILILTKVAAKAAGAK
jgi:tRNA A58 N-methylase Trm61